MYPTIEHIVGNTPLIRLQRLNPNPANVLLAKLEGHNPAGSVKDRPAMHIIRQAEQAGIIKPGDTLIEATSGNTGIAMAMAAAVKGYNMILIMPENMTAERKAAMQAYGAELILVSPTEGMEGARDLARKMGTEGKGLVLDQFNNPANPQAHYAGTGPEIWQQTQGAVTHFISSMGTTGTVTGTSRYLKACNTDVQIIGLRPAEGASIPGIRRWPEAYMPGIFDDQYIDHIMDITQQDAEHTMRLLAREEGILAGISSGGTAYAALELSKAVNHAHIVFIVCDRGDRYLTTGVYQHPDKTG